MLIIHDFTVAKKKNFKTEKKKEHGEHYKQYITKRQEAFPTSITMPVRTTSGLRWCPGLTWLLEAVRAVRAFGLSNGHDSRSGHVLFDALHSTQETLRTLPVSTMADKHSQQNAD